jgi:uncharacterized membrane protein YGL010W
MNSTASLDEGAQRPVDRLLHHYGLSHQHPRNEAIHMFAIPIIMLALVGLIYSLHPWAAYVFLAASLAYYARLGSMLVFACMLVWTVLLLAVIWALGSAIFKVSLGLFVFGWVIQFVGHKIEGKKPSFFEDIQYLWVGPIFVLSRPMLRLGVKW